MIVTSVGTERPTHIIVDITAFTTCDSRLKSNRFHNARQIPMCFCSERMTLSVIADGNLRAALVIKYVLIYNSLHNSHAALITSGVSAVQSIQSFGCVCLIDTAVGIVTLHGVAVIGTNAIGDRLEQRLILKGG